MKSACVGVLSIIELKNARCNIETSRCLFNAQNKMVLFRRNTTIACNHQHTVMATCLVFTRPSSGQYFPAEVTLQTVQQCFKIKKTFIMFFTPTL